MLLSLLLLQITVKMLYPPGTEPPPKRRHVEQQQPSPHQAPSQLSAREAKQDINTSTVGAAQPVDDVVPEKEQSTYAGLGLGSSDEDE